MRKNKSRLLSIFFSFILIIGNTHVALAKPAAKIQSDAQASLTVRVVTPEITQWPDTVYASGSIVPWQEAIVHAQVDGLLLQDVLVEVGDVVEKGQVLARFDNRTVLAELEQQRAVVAALQATLVEAENNARRAQSLRKSDAVSQQEVSKQNTQAAVARANLDAAQAFLRIKELRLEKTEVIAPDAGIVSSRTTTLGSIASAGTELFRLILDGRLEWKAELVATQISGIQPGQTAHLKLPDGSLIEGVVRYVSPSFNPSTRTAIVAVDLKPGTEGPLSSARAGMFAAGTITLGISEALVIPETSVLSRSGRDYVFALTDDNHVRQVRILTGRRLDNKVEIRSEEGQKNPIDATTRLVESGVVFLNDNILVRVVSDSPATNNPVDDSTPADARH